jgi:hypothetical protein
MDGRTFVSKLYFNNLNICIVSKLKNEVFKGNLKRRYSIFRKMIGIENDFLCKM